MDNVRSHHVKAVREVLEDKKAIPLCPPPYSPDFNSVEKMRSKVKAILRAWKTGSLDALSAALQRALDLISLMDCQHWYAASSYCQQFRCLL